MVFVAFNTTLPLELYCHWLPLSSLSSLNSERSSVFSYDFTYFLAPMCNFSLCSCPSPLIFCVSLIQFCGIICESDVGVPNLHLCVVRCVSELLSIALSHSGAPVLYLQLSADHVQWVLLG